MGNSVKKALPIVFSTIGAVSTIGVAVMSAIDTKNSIEDLKGLKDKPKKEQAKLLLKSYYKTLIVSGISMASTITSAIMSKRIEASLSAALLASEGMYLKYKGKAKQLLGNNANKIVEAISKDEYVEHPEYKSTTPANLLYSNEYLGFFRATEEGIAKGKSMALEHLNNRYDQYTLYDFIKDSDIVILSNDITESNLKMYGWTRAYIEEMYAHNCRDDKGMLDFSIKTEHSFDANGELTHILLEFDMEPIPEMGECFDKLLYDISANEYKYQEELEYNEIVKSKTKRIKKGD